MTAEEQAAADAKAKAEAAAAKEKLDKDFSVRYNQAKEAGQRELFEALGVGSIEDLKAVFQKAGKIESETKTTLADYQKLLADAQAKIKNLETQSENAVMQSEITNAIAAIRPPKAPIASVVREFLNNFELKKDGSRLVPYKRGHSIPELKDGAPATIKEAIENWANDESQSWLFGPKSEIGTATSSTKNYEQELKNPKFVEAVKQSGQYTKLMRGENLDEKALEVYLK